MAKEKYIWIGFNHEGYASGVCLIKSETSQEGIAEMRRLKLMPEGHVIVAVYEIEQQEQELNKFISAEEMREQGYKTSSELDREEKGVT